MKGSSLKTIKILLRSTTALSFALLAAYQTYLAFQIKADRISRLVDIVFYLFLFAASFFALVHQRSIRFLRSVLLVVGLLGLFFARLLSAPSLFGNLNFASIPSVLNCAVYVTSQLGTLILAVYYLAVRTDRSLKNKRKLTVLLMSVVIALYALGLIVGCVLRIKYRVNIDLSLKYALIGCVLLFWGFAGTAVNFMLPSGKVKTGTELYINKEHRNADIVLSSSENDKPRSDKDEMRNPVLNNTDIVFSHTENIRARSKRR